MLRISSDDPLAIAVMAAIRGGDVATLERLLAEHAGLATARIVDVDCAQPGTVARSLLHVATDWPGNFPRGVETVAALLAAGADVNAAFDGPHAETPLHWAASSDDVAVLDALLDAGADIEAAGAVIGGGTPIADAVAFGQWTCARRLLERGARTSLWQAAALGLTERVRDELAGDPPPTAGDVTNALWCAAHGGQRTTAQLLLDAGGDVRWAGHDGLTAEQAARREGHDELAAWLRGLGG